MAQRQRQPSRLRGSRSRSDPLAVKDSDNATQVVPRSKVTVYDTVAGRVGINGFLSAEQLRSSNVNPLAPEEVLFKRADASQDSMFDIYNADERLPASEKLPDPDLLKAIHAYVSDFYDALPDKRDKIDFRSMDETALLAFGILLEEAAKEVLGENGDMVLVEPEGLDIGLPESKMTEYQVKGKVEPPLTPEGGSDKDDEDEDEDEDIEIARRGKRRRLT